LRESKNNSSRQFLREFPEKHWTRSELDKLLRKISVTGSVDRVIGSGRRKSARTEENVALVGDLIQSQEDAPKTHRTTRQISRETGIHRSSVVRIIHEDLQLKCLKKKPAQELTEANRLTRLNRSRQLLRKYPRHMVDFIFFTDEKLFTVARPSNTQNDRLYITRGTKKGRLLQTDCCVRVPISAGLLWCPLRYRRLVVPTWSSLILELKLMEPIIETFCFHNIFYLSSEV